ncbi:MAG TPA: O-antigen ligase family protein [Isosphaeraceae bacterium]|nr:O-antigen ligase family protein [Isosphaeraceae bacterium]
MTRLPGLAIAGLALLALVQAAPLPAVVLQRVAPAASALRTEILEERSVRVGGDTRPPIASPPATVSRDAEATRDNAARLLAAWILFQGVLSHGASHGAFRRFGKAVAINAMLLALFALIQILTWNGKVYGMVRAASGHGGPFICHNHLAAYLNIGLGFALAWLLAPRSGETIAQGRGSRLCAAYTASVILVGVLASLSRSGFLGMVSAAMVTIVAIRPKPVRLAGGLAAVLALACVFQFAAGISAPVQRLATLAGGQPFAERWEIWREVAGAWSSSPALGTGLGSFPAATAAFLTRDRGEFFAHAENEYLELLIEGGIIGLGIALLGLLASASSVHCALRAAAGRGEGALFLGGLFGVTALATQSLGDFPLHIPAVAVVATILAGHLARLGQYGSELLCESQPGPITVSRAKVTCSRVAGLAMIVASLALVFHGARRARAEAELAGSGVPPAGTEMPSAGLLADSLPKLERMRNALGKALRHRPDWVEGHLRLGQVHLSLYARTATEWITTTRGVGGSADRFSDPLWLHGVIHSLPQEDRPSIAELLDYDPVRLHLVPAARSFLEARRCCPWLSLSHAELAGLDYLLLEGSPPSAHAGRALRLAGSDSQTMARLARTAAQAGDFDLAARCWRRQLSVQQSDWAEVADIVSGLLSPSRILDEVLPSGRMTLRFAQRLYATPDQRAVRDRFLRAALDRLPHDAEHSTAERLYLEGEALALLGDRDQACERVNTALALDPHRTDWRRELVGWLVQWGRLREAHDQALIAQHFAPGDADAERALKTAVEALARGSSSPAGEQP